MQSFSVEHIEPRSRRGETVLDNLALSCQGCNNFKYTKVEGIDPVSGKAAPLFHPRRDRWRDHFTWSADFTQVIGTTPAGRATVDKLQLNRKGLLNLRQLLYAAGKHPPPDGDVDSGASKSSAM
jgi:hypothetical protein